MTKPYSEDDHLDVVYDVTAIMKIVSRKLTDGRPLDEEEAKEMGWLLESHTRRLDPVIEYLENKLTENVLSAEAAREEGGTRRK